MADLAAAGLGGIDRGEVGAAECGELALGVAAVGPGSLQAFPQFWFDNHCAFSSVLRLRSGSE